MEIEAKTRQVEYAEFSPQALSCSCRPAGGAASCLRVVVVVAVLAALAACTPKSVRYHAPALSAAGAATLLIRDNRLSSLTAHATEVVTIDGKRPPFWDFRLPPTVKLTPGEHEIGAHMQTVALFKKSLQHGALFTIVVKAGHEYRVLAAKEGAIVTFWAEDTATKEVVGKRTITIEEEDKKWWQPRSARTP